MSFASEQWQRTVLTRTDKGHRIARRHFEVCVFSSLASALKSGDVAVRGSDAYADYREQLLPWSECEPQVDEYCRGLGIPVMASDFVKGRRTWLTETAQRVDVGFTANADVSINVKLIRRPRPGPSASAHALEAALLDRMPERSLLDILAIVNFWTQWTRHFGPLSGSEPKPEKAHAAWGVTVTS